MLTFGKTYINPEAFRDVSKEQFIEMYKGKINFCLNEAWDMIQEALNGESFIFESSGPPKTKKDCGCKGKKKSKG